MTVKVINRDQISAHLYRAILPSRWGTMRRVYGLTPEVFVDLVCVQGGKCAVCDSYLNFEGRRWHIDRARTTGKVRGILCHFCNTNLIPVLDRFSHLVEPARRYLDRTL